MHDIDLNKNVNVINKLDKYTLIESEIIHLFFTRLNKGFKFSNNKRVAEYSISDYIFNLYHKRLLKLDNTKVLKLIKENYVDLDKNIDSDIVDIVECKFDKEILKNFFLSKVNDYSLNKMILKYPYRTRKSLIDEIRSFIKAWVYFESHLKTRNKNIKVKIEYTQAETKRYFTFIGMLDKRVRDNLLTEYTEFDLDAAAPNFLYQYYMGLGNKKLKLVNEVITNKKDVRSYIGEVIFLSDKSILKEDKLKYSKKFLTSLFFGSKPNIKGKNATNDILKEVSEILNTNYESLKHYFYNNEIIKDLIQEVKILMDTLDEFLKTRITTISKNTDILSIHGKDINVQYKKSKTRKNTRIAYFYQSWESKFLDTEVQILKEKFGISNNYIKLHDAIYIHKNELKKLSKKNIFEEDIRQEFRKIRVTDIDIEPLI